MFLDIKRAGNEPIESDKPWKYKIIDDDFEEVIEASDLLDAVIKVYKNKNLNVIKNVVKFVQLGNIKYGYTEYNNKFIIKWLSKYSPELIDEFKKYIMLM
jgi:hypothetical protein